MAVPTTGYDMQMIDLLLSFALVQSSVHPGAAEYTRDDVARNLSAWIARADDNGDAKLNRDEWQAASALMFPEMPPLDLRRMAERDLDHYDRNNDGFVDLAELSAPSLVGFACLDTDHNGRVSAAERLAGEHATCLPSRAISE